MWAAEEGGCCGSWGVVGWGVALISAGVPAPGRPWGLPVIPSPRLGGMMGFAVLVVGGVNQRGRPRLVWGS